MKSKSTLVLFLAAALLVGGFFIARRNVPPTEETEGKKNRVVELKAADVSAVEIKGVDRDFRFEKSGAKWEMVRPLKVRANASEIEGILSTLEYMDCRRTLSPRQIAEQKLSLADYGLDKPRITATIQGRQGPVVFQIGNEAKQGASLYIQVAGNSDILLVEKDLATRLSKKIEDYRERALFDFSAAQINRVSLKNGSKLLEFSKTNQLWRIIQPLNARVDAGVLDEFLRKTADLRAEDFLSDDPVTAKEFGLEEPAQEVSVVLDGSEGTQTLLLGQKLKADDKKTAVRVKGQNAIVAIPSAYSGDIARPLNDFRDRSLAAFDAANISEIELKNRQVIVSLEREGDVWKIVQPEKIAAESDVVKDVIARLSSLQIKDFTADVVTDLDKFGLKTPLFGITLKGRPLAGAEAAKTNAAAIVYLNLAIGKEDTAKKLTYVKVGDESSVYGLDTARVADLPRSALELRTRVLFEIKKETVKSCTQKRSKGSVTLDRGEGGKWKIAEGVTGVLEENAWQKFLNLLQRFAVEKIMGTALNTTIGKYGLESPSATLSIKAEADGKTVTQEILVGRETAEKRRYILWKNQLLVCEVTSEMAQILSNDWLTRPAGK